ncbi:MAG: ATP-binding cassette domain-containing protein [Cyanobacteriota bacterium]|nr:ATP-binding cassette domain-containing protein [Cyanobacteriota bacterium]
MIRGLPQPTRRPPSDLSETRVTTATVLQYEAVECGAASLKIVMGYLGKVLPLAELRERCGISRDGVTAVQLKYAAIKLGLEVKAFRCSAQHLLEKGRFPCILFWNFNHFLVLEGFERGKAFLSDPASGRRSVEWDEFETSFTGVVLELRPGAEFVAGGKDPSLYRWVPSLVAPYRSLLPWLVLVSVAGALPELFIAGSTSQFIDGFLQDGRENIAIPVIWITAIAVVVLIALVNLQKLLLRVLGNLLLKRISSLLYVSLFSLPYRYFVQRMRGEVASRLILPFSLVQLGVTGIVDFLLSLGSGLLALIVGLLISPWLSLLTLGIAGGNSALTLWIREQRKGDNYKLAMVQGKASGIGVYVIQCIESIKASGLENESFMQWSSAFNDGLAELQKQSLATALVGLIGTTSGFLLRCSVIMVGGLLIILGQISLGELMAFQFLMGMIQAPLAQLNLLSSQLQQLDGQVGRTNDVIDSDVDPLVRSFQFGASQLSESSEDGLRRSERQLPGGLELHNLGFQFSSTTPMLFGGLTLKLKPGEHLAIVGGSGSGKSTLLRMVAGLYQPSQGQILYDGRPWLGWDDPTLRASIALVSQDVFLFPATLEQNLTLWDPRFNSSNALVALDDAGLLDDLGGAGALGLHLGEGGGNLSGGQRQRVEIARALLRQPSLLLMDEATSALDDRRERQVLEAVKRTPRTLITVAHRLHAAEISDWVLVLDQGQLVEQGHPRELAKSGGYYSQLLEAELVSQAGAQTP